jgi:hypothetical protein
MYWEKIMKIQVLFFVIVLIFCLSACSEDDVAVSPTTPIEEVNSKIIDTLNLDSLKFKRIEVKADGFVCPVEIHRITWNHSRNRKDLDTFEYVNEKWKFEHLLLDSILCAEYQHFYTRYYNDTVEYDYSISEFYESRYCKIKMVFNKIRTEIKMLRISALQSFSRHGDDPGSPSTSWDKSNMLEFFNVPFTYIAGEFRIQLNADKISNSINKFKYYYSRGYVYEPFVYESFTNNTDLPKVDSTGYLSIIFK